MRLYALLLCLLNITGLSCHFHVVVILQSRRDMVLQLRKELRTVQEAMLNEGTCFMCNVLEDTSRPGLFFMYQTWKDKKEYEEHYKKPYVKKFIANFDILLAQQNIIVTGTPII